MIAVFIEVKCTKGAIFVPYLFYVNELSFMTAFEHLWNEKIMFTLISPQCLPIVQRLQPEVLGKSISLWRRLQPLIASESFQPGKVSSVLCSMEKEKTYTD